jgi:hypothetical protein
MAKAKKQTRSRKVAEAPPVQTVRSPFRSHALAVLILLIAVFMMLGGFHTGGTLPISLFHAGYWTVGWAAYLIPCALAYWAMYKFRTENHRIPVSKVMSILAVLLFSAGWFYVTFATKTAALTSGGHGGSIGKAAGGAVLGALDKLPASLLFFVATALSLFFALGIPIDVFKNLSVQNPTRAQSSHYSKPKPPNQHSSSMREFRLSIIVYPKPASQSVNRFA